MVLYFGYGSNLNQEDLDCFCKENNLPLIDLKLKSPKVCMLEDYELKFNYYSQGRRGGAANIEAKEGEVAEGVLFEISNDDKQIIDRKEGAPNYYEEFYVSVCLRDGTKIDNVLTYVVCESRKNGFTPPTKKYRQILIDGAEAFGLSEDWINKLKKIPCI